MGFNSAFKGLKSIVLQIDLYVAEKCVLGPIEYRNTCPVLETVSESTRIKMKGKANLTL